MIAITSQTTNSTVPMIPMILPAVAMPRPPSAPPEASICCSALARPRYHAIGAKDPAAQEDDPTIPSTSETIAFVLVGWGWAWGCGVVIGTSQVAGRSVRAAPYRATLRKWQ